MIAVVDRVVQYPHRYKLTNIENGQVLGTFDLDPVLGTIQAEGTKINKALFDSIATDIAAKLTTEGGDLKNTIITFDEFTGSAEIASGDKASLIIAKIKKRLKDFEANYETRTDASKKLEEAKTYAAEQASTAKSEAISTAASDATTKANQAQSSANSYTDEQIDTLSKSFDAELEKKADLVNGKVPANQIPTTGVNVEQAEKDGSGNVITATYETKKDAATKLSEAKTYAEQKASAAQSAAISAAASDATNKANAAQSAATAAAAADATQKANQAETNANNYTNTKIKELENATFSKEVICDHKYEITGHTNHEFNLAISESVVKIKKIQGQTRRKSLNLLTGGQLQSNGTFLLKYTNEKAYYTTNLITGLKVLKESGYYTLYVDTLPVDSSLIIRGYLSGGGYDNVARINSSGSSRPYVLSFYYDNSIDYISFDLLFILTNLNETSSYNGYLKPMLLKGTYTNETMQSFEPYDNTLVNSKCNLISTNKNLFSILPFKTFTKNGITYIGEEKFTIKGTSTKAERVYFDILPIPKGDYTINWGNDFTLESGRMSINFVDESDNLIFYINNYPSTNITQKINITNTVTRMFVNIPSGNAINGSIKPMLVYGSETLPYEPHEKATTVVNKEYKAFDYHDNLANQDVLQTSEVRILNGTENWTWQEAPKRYVANLGLTPPLNDYYNINTASNWIDITSDDTNNKGKNGIAIENTEILLSNTSFVNDVAGLKQWLQQNPISFVYKKATPTIIENVFLPDGYKVWNGGLQIQETDTIPYILTKEYAISMKAQIDANAEINVSQQEQIDENAKKIDNIANVLYPIGSVFKAGISQEPNSIFGGSWFKLSSTALSGSNKKGTIIEWIRVEAARRVQGTTGSISQSTPEGQRYFYSGSINIGAGKTLVLANGSLTSLSYSSSTGELSFTLYGTSPNTSISDIIYYA